jgi:hypothetical protein
MLLNGCFLYFTTSPAVFCHFIHHMWFICWFLRRVGMPPTSATWGDDIWQPKIYVYQQIFDIHIVGYKLPLKLLIHLLVIQICIKSKWWYIYFGSSSIFIDPYVKVAYMRLFKYVNDPSFYCKNMYQYAKVYGKL